MKKRLSVKGLSFVLVLVLFVTSAFGCAKMDKKENAVNDAENMDSVEMDDDVIGDIESDGTQEETDTDSSVDNDTEGSDDGTVSDDSDNGNADGDNISGGDSDGDSSDSGNSDSDSDSSSSSDGNSDSDSGSGNDNLGSGNSSNDGSNSNSGTSSDTSSAGEQMAHDIVDQIITPGMSDFEIAITIHDWLTYNIDYDLTYARYSLEEALNYRSVVCTGYALAFECMARYAGLEVMYIEGVADGGGHAWNKVKVDGVWYNVDVTWDDPVWKGKDPNDHSRNQYLYFLLSDEEMSKDHRPGYGYEGPQSGANDYDRSEIYRFISESGKSNGYVYVDSLEVMVEEAVRQFEAGNDTIRVWCYVGKDDNVGWERHEYVNQSILQSKYGPCFSGMGMLISVDNGLLELTAIPEISFEEWGTIPIVTTGEEYNEFCRSQLEQGIRQIKVRIEPINNNEVFYLGDWIFEYGIKTINEKSTEYNQNQWVLLEISLWG